MGPIQTVDIKTDGGTQSRARLHDEIVERYADELREGAEFPPVVVFYDGADYWMADGFHRLAAYRQIGEESISAEIKQGTRLDALRYSLSANATHGMPRTNDDYRRAYHAAVDNDLCGPDDTKAVQELLRCSVRWARELTKDAREIAKLEKDRKIAELSAQGKSQREVAREVGVDPMTVNKRMKQMAVEKRHSAETLHPTHEPPANKQIRRLSAEEREHQEPPMKPKAQESNLYAENSPFSAKALLIQIKTKIGMISNTDPNALYVLEEVSALVSARLSKLSETEVA